MKCTDIEEALDAFEIEGLQAFTKDDWSGIPLKRFQKFYAEFRVAADNLKEYLEDRMREMDD